MSSVFPTTEDVADTIMKALTLMNEEGAHWTKGEYVTDCGTQFCAIGGLRAAVGIYDGTYDRLPYSEQMRLDWKLEQATMALAREIDATRVTTHPSSSVVIGWNDSPDRTWPEVVDVFTRTANRLREAPS